MIGAAAIAGVAIALVDDLVGLSYGAQLALVGIFVAVALPLADRLANASR